MEVLDELVYMPLWQFIAITIYMIIVQIYISYRVLVRLRILAINYIIFVPLSLLFFVEK